MGLSHSRQDALVGLLCWEVFTSWRSRPEETLLSSHTPSGAEAQHQMLTALWDRCSFHGHVCPEQFSLVQKKSKRKFSFWSVLDSRQNSKFCSQEIVWKRDRKRRLWSEMWVKWGSSNLSLIFILCLKAQLECRNSGLNWNVSNLWSNTVVKATCSNSEKCRHFGTSKCLGRSRDKKSPFQEKRALDGHMIFPDTVLRQNDNI